jgi:hypothetical protein
MVSRKRSSIACTKRGDFFFRPLPPPTGSPDSWGGEGIGRGQLPEAAPDGVAAQARNPGDLSDATATFLSGQERSHQTTVSLIEDGQESNDGRVLTGQTTAAIPFAVRALTAMGGSVSVLLHETPPYWCMTKHRGILYEETVKLFRGAS